MGEVKGEYILKDALIERLYHSPVNVYALFNEIENGTKLVAFFEIDSVFINESNNPDVSLIANNILEEFAINVYKDAVNDELKEEEKKLKDLENDEKTD